MAKSSTTSEDVKIVISLFCCVSGIGTLGMPGNFSRAGPILGTAALIFMAFANIYASVACSKVMLRAPAHVKTLGDLGQWCSGTIGRHTVQISQMAVCLLTTCVFLELGGDMLNSLFPATFSKTFWIIFMAVSVSPLCLKPTLKEGAGVALAGCAGTIIADVLALILLLGGMSGHPPTPQPELNFDQIAGAFGNLSLAYAAAVLIPSLQIEHSKPERMPFLIGATLSVVTVMFFAIAATGYSAVGCQISGNLLFSVFPDPRTGLSVLGFRPHKGIAVLAYLAMQMHVTIAFSVFLHPTFYMLERLLLGMHQPKIAETPYYNLETSSGQMHEICVTPERIEANIQSCPIISEHESTFVEEEEEYGSSRNALKYVALRLTLVALLVITSIIFQNRINEFADFTGASFITISCIVLPIIFYLQKLWKEIPYWEKAAAIIVLLVCGILGSYETYTSGRDLIVPSTDKPDFPFCRPELEDTLYYNATAVQLSRLVDLPLQLNYNDQFYPQSYFR